MSVMGSNEQCSFEIPDVDCREHEPGVFTADAEAFMTIMKDAMRTAEALRKAAANTYVAGAVRAGAGIAFVLDTTGEKPIARLVIISENIVTEQQEMNAAVLDTKSNDRSLPLDVLSRGIEDFNHRVDATERGVPIAPPSPDLLNSDGIDKTENPPIAAKLTNDLFTTKRKKPVTIKLADDLTMELPAWQPPRTVYKDPETRIIGLCLVDGVIDSDAVGRLVGANNQPLRNIRVSIADAQMRDTLLTAQKGNRYVRVELELITSYGNTFTMNRSTERMPTYLVVSAVLEEIVPCAQLALTFQ